MFYWSLPLAAVAGGVLLAANIIALVIRLIWRDSKASDRPLEKWHSVLVLPFCAVNMLLLGTTGFFDRYVLVFMPFLLVAIVSCIRYRSRFRLGPANITVGILLVIYAVFSVTSTHDYLSWNRARWKALDYLVKDQDISPEYIDGGFEFNGWHNYNLKRGDSKDERRAEAGKSKDKSKKSWWWVIEDEYVISFGPIEGYSQQRCYSYKRWLPPGRGQILILHRDPSRQ